MKSEGRKKRGVLLAVMLMAFLLASVMGAGLNASSVYAAQTKAAAVKPGKPVLVSVTNKPGGIVFKWKKAANAAGYHVYRKTGSGSYKRIATVKGAATVSYSDKAVKNKSGVTYTYTVRAYNGSTLSDFDTVGKKIKRSIPASIKLNKTSASVEVKSTVKLKATVTGDSKKVTWSSSNSAVASVSGGVVTGKKAGKAVITAKANGKTAKCTVTVKAGYKSLYEEFLSQAKVEAEYGPISPNWYYVLDVDQSGVPELIVNDYSGALTDFYVYTVKNGKMVYLGYCGTKGLGSVPVISYVSKYKGLVTSGWTNFIGGVWWNMFGISGSKLTNIHHMREAHNPGDEFYVGNTDSTAKKVSEAEYQKFYNTYFKDSLVKKYTMLKNTEANRKNSFK